MSVEPKNLNKEENDWQEFLLQANSSSQVKSFVHISVSTCSEPAGPPCGAKDDPKWCLKRVELDFFDFLEQRQNTRKQQNFSEKIWPETNLKGEEKWQDLIKNLHFVSKSFDDQMAISADINGDNRGERKVRSENDWSVSTPAENRERQRPERHDNSNEDENSVVRYEAGTDEVDRRLLSEFGSHWKLLKAADRLFSN